MLTGAYDKTTDTITLKWQNGLHTKASIIHYGNKGVNTPAQMTLMGYSEGDTWKLSGLDIPTWAVGDKLYFAVNSYFHTGIGATDIDKAKSLNDSTFGSSDWSTIIEITKT